MLSLQQIENIIEDSINKVEWRKEPALLYQPLKYIMELGGKRIRPKLCITTYSLFKENLDETIINPALALEVFHNFTLIHDDIMDKAELRRGFLTVEKKWNTNVAILSGDAMCISSYILLNMAQPQKQAELLKVFSQTALQVCEGQQIDMDFESAEQVKMEEYIKMIGLKTAVLIACASKMGGILGDAPADICDALYDFGYQLGLAFQVQDDYLDSFGDEKVFGKKIGGDILNNKKTWLLIKCLELIDNQERKKLHSLFDLEDGKKKISAVKNFYENKGIKEHANNAISEYYENALSTLEKTTLSLEQKEQLILFAKTLIGRDK